MPHAAIYRNYIGHLQELVLHPHSTRHRWNKHNSNYQRRLVQGA
ncbi:hypothetical protein [Phage Phass-1]|uniref:Uncharacterized protein n=1 Tax=Phage Phass-1 TaxID=3043662 RepID=A0AAF0LWH7_9CAUD|nr:hypothetical protein [Phage Phass-1]